MPVTGRTVQQGGRAKAYRPLAARRRRTALVAFLAAYDQGDAFLAHELLEPAWMGTADMAERELYQGLIKLAAAEVHAVRGNPLGEAKNLRGARARLASAVAFTRPGPGASGGPAGGPDAGLDLAHLLGRIDERLARLADDAGATHPDPAPAQGPRIALPRRPSAV